MISERASRTVGTRISMLWAEIVWASSTQAMVIPWSERRLSMFFSNPRKMISDPVCTWRIARSVIQNSPSSPRSRMRFSISAFELSLIEFWNCLQHRMNSYFSVARMTM
jgi:hypothetical protein